MKVFQTPTQAGIPPGGTATLGFTVQPMDYGPTGVPPCFATVVQPESSGTNELVCCSVIFISSTQINVQVQNFNGGSTSGPYYVCLLIFDSHGQALGI